MRKKCITLLTLLVLCLSLFASTVHAADYRHNRLHAVPPIPKLVATYNGANGIGVKWQITTGAAQYVIYRKYNGKWAKLAEVGANNPSLQKSGNTLMYTDQTVKTKYGQGFIYSVAAKNSSGISNYNTAGLPAYRLVPPTIRSVKVTGDGEVMVTWNKVACQGYEVQYAPSTNTSNWIKARQVTATSQTISGLTQNTKYVFRIRCQKTNKDRGTTWSEYSPWASVRIENPRPAIASLYKKYMEKKPQSQYGKPYRFAVVDLDNNGIPELLDMHYWGSYWTINLVYINGVGAKKIYDIDGKKQILGPPVSIGGAGDGVSFSVSYFPGRNGLVFTTKGGGGFIEANSIFTIENNCVSPILYWDKGLDKNNNIIYHCGPEYYSETIYSSWSEVEKRIREAIGTSVSKKVTLHNNTAANRKKYL